MTDVLLVVYFCPLLIMLGFWLKIRTRTAFVFAIIPVVNLYWVVFFLVSVVEGCVIAMRKRG